jgi:hypothetical protein
VRLGCAIVSYLDGKVIDGTPACCKSWLVEGPWSGRRALERGDARVQPCDLSLLLLELPSLLLDLLMGDGLTENACIWASATRSSHHIEEMPAQSSSTHIDTVLQKHYQVCG